MWNFDKSVRDAVHAITGRMKRDPDFAPAFTAYLCGFEAANPAGYAASKVFYQHGLDSGACFNTAVLHLFREAAEKTGQPVEAKIIRRGQKPKIRTVADVRIFMKNLPSARVTQVVLSVPQRDGRSPHVRGQSKPSR